MSRVGNSPINFSEGTMVTVSNNIVTVKGKLGELSQSCLLYTSDAADE